MKRRLLVFLVVMATVLLGSQAYGFYNKQQLLSKPLTDSSTVSQVAQKPIVKKALSPDDIDKAVLLSETNAHRVANGLVPLILDTRLNQSAQDKCNDMVVRNYWSHNAPDGTEPWVFITADGIPYKRAAENLAVGQEDAKAVVTGWTKSPKHNTNLLDPLLTNVGFAICVSDDYVESGLQVIIVQHFIAL
jgi:uncharacterized protein YkwD